MAAGRPTAFKEEMLEIAREYIEGGYADKGQVIPSVEGLAKELNVTRSTIYKWNENKNHPFSDTLEKCNAEQKLVLINKGLTGEFNSNITKLALGNHGFSDKSENKNEDTLNVRIIGDDAETL